MDTAFVQSALPASFRAPSQARGRCRQRVPGIFVAHRISPRMHGPPASAEAGTRRRRPGEHKGFVEEMRFVAMRLHTKDQAPREGEQEASALPIDAWFPARADFMQFLIDSRAVYDYFENDLTRDGTSHPIFSRFAQTGLERVAALDTDIAYLKELGVSVSAPSIRATRYVEYLKGLLQDKPESVLCHWYNYYFAHTAGGRMIGRLMQDRLFGGRHFAFYEWESDVKETLNKVRVIIDEVAADWPREIKDDCLKETGLAFGYSGTVLQNLAKAAS